MKLKHLHNSMGSLATGDGWLDEKDEEWSVPAGTNPELQAT